MRAETKIVERLKSGLLDDLRLMTPGDYEAYWRQAKWGKPNLVELGKDEFIKLPDGHGGTAREAFAPLRYALKKLPPEILATASEQPDPFAWILETVDVSEWLEFCHSQRTPWLARVWLATASQLGAERDLIFKAHGWGFTWQELRQHPSSTQAAEAHFSAQLSHARPRRREELLAIQIRGLSEAARRRLRRAKTGQGKRAGVSRAEKFLVQYWLELPRGLPGLCFLSDIALHSVLEIFRLSTGDGEATKQVRARLGLIQAGAKRHLVQDVVAVNDKLSFNGDMMKDPYVIRGTLSWGNQRLWPRRHSERTNRVTH